MERQTTTIKPRGRCSGGCIPDTSGYRCSYCHFELSPNTEKLMMELLRLSENDLKRRRAKEKTRGRLKLKGNKVIRKDETNN